MTTSDKLARAKTAVVLDVAFAFFGSLTLRVEYLADPTCDTMWTNGKQIGYNPAFVDELTAPKLKGCLCHEDMHNANGHHTRRGNRKPELWNSACDYAINPILVAAGCELPDGAFIDKRFEGMSAEAIYNVLAQEGNGGGEGNGENGAGSAPNDAQGTVDGQGKAPQGQTADPGKCGEIRDAVADDGKPASPSNMAQQAQDWKVAATQAAQQAKARGRLPASLERYVDELVNPLIDWRDALRRFVSQTAKSDYTWQRPNRRYIHAGLYLPSCRNEELPPLVVAVDTSGSIDRDTLAQFGAELTAILEAYKTEATVIYCDARIQRVEHYTADDLPLTLRPVGGGGTDFRPVFAHVDKLADVPSCLVYLTDMEGTFPTSAPQYPVLWARIGDYGKQPPFGEIVKVA